MRALIEHIEAQVLSEATWKTDPKKKAVEVYDTGPWVAKVTGQNRVYVYGTGEFKLRQGWLTKQNTVDPSGAGYHAHEFPDKASAKKAAVTWVKRQQRSPTANSRT